MLFFSSKKEKFFDFAATSWLRQQLEMILQGLIKYIPGKKKKRKIMKSFVVVVVVI